MVGGVKDRLRADARAARLARSAEQIDSARASVRAQVLAGYEAAGRSWRCVAAYRPLRTEPGSTELLDEFVARGVRVLVPVLLDDKDLDWVGWSAPTDPLGPDAIGSADLVLVPALAVDVHGVRLGRGGGSYDRALARVRVGVPIVALLFDGEFVENALPADEWDVPVTAVVSPAQWREIG